MRQVLAYTDGSNGRDGYGGAAAILIGRRSVLEIGAWIAPPCTNQDAELLGVLLAFAALKEEGVRIKIITDSAYVVNCFRDGWIPKWRRNGWLNSAKKPVVHRAVWETIESHVVLHDVEFEHVKGHSGDHYNERADEIAHNARVRRVSGERRIWRSGLEVST